MHCKFLLESGKIMLIKRFIRPFRQLQGKLTLSYTLTSVVTFLLIEVTAIAIVLWFVSLNVSNIVLNNLKQEAPQAAPYFVHGSPDSEALASWLLIINPSVANQGPFNNHPTVFLTAVDTYGQVIASICTHAVLPGILIQTQLSTQNRNNLRAVLTDRKGTMSTNTQEADGTLLAITPIVGQEGKVQGALIMKIVRPDIFQLVSAFLQLIVVTVVIVTTIAAIAGMVFGYLTARGLTRRLKGLTTAADRWGRGDFSALAHDASEDELGHLGRQLNRMAEQLQNLLQARQKLATLEERNRLARDLHDSVKQQIFAVAMQIGATKVLLKRDVDAAEVRLNEAEKLVRQAQQELTSLIRELRPVALEGKGLVAALRELATEWAQQTNVVANLRVEGTQETQGHPQGMPLLYPRVEGAQETQTQGHPQGMPLLYSRVEGAQETQRVQTLPLTVEEALYRVAQEALANVSRHSKATLVQMILMITDQTVTLSIVDNGQGFDTTRQGYLGIGLLSMRERMKALGGDVQVESTPGKGTRVFAFCNRLGVDTAMVGDEGEVTTHIQR